MNNRDSYRLEKVLSTYCYRKQNYRDTAMSQPIVTPLIITSIIYTIFSLDYNVNIFRGGETLYDIFCTENILNLSLYQTLTSLTLSV